MRFIASLLFFMYFCRWYEAAETILYLTGYLGFSRPTAGHLHARARGRGLLCAIWEVSGLGLLRPPADGGTAHRAQRRTFQGKSFHPLCHRAASRRNRLVGLDNFTPQNVDQQGCMDLFRNSIFLSDVLGIWFYHHP